MASRQRSGDSSGIGMASGPLLAWCFFKSPLSWTHDPSSSQNLTGPCFAGIVMSKEATPEVCLSKAYLANLFCIL